ncbi:hypothetical protein AGMMS49938_12940 [Fibrobacterales bacterium]|nr:hypothetical protein AGMMS49938_12940 [Fibrobacterales bacterium]
MKFLKILFREFAVPIVFALVVIAFAIQAFKIPSGSMENSLYEGDFLLGLKFVYGIPIPFADSKIPVSAPDTGDVVIFRYPGEPEYPDYDKSRYIHLANALMLGNFFWDTQSEEGQPKLVHYADGPKDYIKRCVAKSGQRVAVQNGRLFIDGAEQSLKGEGKYTERHRGNSPRDFLREIKVPEKGETIAFDTLDIHNLWWLRSLMVQEMPDSLIEFEISLNRVSINAATDGANLSATNSVELNNYVFGNFRVPIENQKYQLINTIFSQNRVVGQGLSLGDTIDGVMSLNFFKKFARTGFLPRYAGASGAMPKGMFGSRLVGYDAFDGSQLEDLEYNVALENSRLAESWQAVGSEARDSLKLVWKILVNGKEVHEYTVRDEVYFMMGDNRDNSADSRYWGFVSTRNIKAKAFIVYFSLDKDSKVELLNPLTWWRLPADIRWKRIARVIHLI